MKLRNTREARRARWWVVSLLLFVDPSLCVVMGDMSGDGVWS